MARTPTDERVTSRPKAEKRPKQTRRLVDLAQSQTGRLTDKALAKAAEFAETKKDEAAAQLDAVAGVVRNFAETADGDLAGVVGVAANRGGDAIGSIAQSIRDRSVDDIVDDTRAAITRHPAIAIGVASLFGFAAGRIFKAGISQPASSRPSEQSLALEDAA